MWKKYIVEISMNLLFKVTIQIIKEWITIYVLQESSSNLGKKLSRIKRLNVIEWICKSARGKYRFVCNFEMGKLLLKARHYSWKLKR